MVVGGAKGVFVGEVFLPVEEKLWIRWLMDSCEDARKLSQDRLSKVMQYF